MIGPYLSPMIRYTLACDAGHDFESWFPSSAAYDEQAARGLVSCPFCESRKVGKALMAPALGRGRRAPVEASMPRPATDVPATEASVTEASVPMIAEPERRLRAMFRAMREHVVRTADHVGPRFAAEARAMHDGASPHRSIYGEATSDEARALIEDGIDVCPLPSAPDDRN